MFALVLILQNHAVHVVCRRLNCTVLGWHDQEAGADIGDTDKQINQEQHVTQQR